MEPTDDDSALTFPFQQCCNGESSVVCTLDFDVFSTVVACNLFKSIYVAICNNDLVHESKSYTLRKYLNDESRSEVYIPTQNKCLD